MGQQRQRRKNCFLMAVFCDNSSVQAPSPGNDFAHFKAVLLRQVLSLSYLNTFYEKFPILSFDSPARSVVTIAAGYYRQGKKHRQ